MKESELISPTEQLEYLGIQSAKKIHWNLSPAELIEEALKNKEGNLADTGALMCDTGKFTGRSPKDKFIVKDAITKDAVWWGEINIPIEPHYFDKVLSKMADYLKDKVLYVRDAVACDHPDYRQNIRIINTYAWHNLFCYNMFIRPEKKQFDENLEGYTIINAPDFHSNPEEDGTRQGNFTMVNFTRKIILIGGSGYAGEMKKGIFSVLNFTLPHFEKVFPMHCSANIGKNEDAAIFFGLSGTGKTTLSADPERKLIGDDEHGWTNDGVFNFEGGCYAKVVNLTRKKEPEIFDAIKFGTIVENTRFIEGSRTIDYENITVTQNTRTAYPIYHIKNAVNPSRGPIPKNIFFLTCDAYGVFPPISKLDKGQAMYHFISGYTAKVAGTEAGVTDPQIVFSACFGAPFLPLHPTKYAEMLGEKMKKHQVKIWLVNTGWSGGGYGKGKRIDLKYTRAMISAALNHELDNIEYKPHPVFGIQMPVSCPRVPPTILDPRNTWEDKQAYDEKTHLLANHFINNFQQFSEYANEEIMKGAPKVL